MNECHITTRIRIQTRMEITKSIRLDVRIPQPTTTVCLWVSMLPVARRQRLHEQSLAEELMDANGAAQHVIEAVDHTHGNTDRPLVAACRTSDYAVGLGAVADHPRRLGRKICDHLGLCYAAGEIIGIKCEEAKCGNVRSLKTYCSTYQTTLPSINNCFKMKTL